MQASLMRVPALARTPSNPTHPTIAKMPITPTASECLVPMIVPFLIYEATVGPRSQLVFAYSKYSCALAGANELRFSLRAITSR